MRVLGVRMYLFGVIIRHFNILPQIIVIKTSQIGHKYHFQANGQT